MSRSLALLCRSGVVGFLCLLAWAGPATALPADVGIANTSHTRWTALEGGPPPVTAMAQTPDGWLWLGTSDGLYRFDGDRFARFALPARGLLNRQRIAGLHAEPNGKLWILYVAGRLSVLHPDGRLDDIPDAPVPLGGINAVAVDRDGSVWAATPSGMHRFDGKAWHTAAIDGKFAADGLGSLALDQYGQLWAADDAHAWRLDRSSGRFEQATAPGGKLTMSPDGRLWLLRRGQLRLLPSGRDGAVRPRPAWFNQSESRVGGQFDADGTLWTLDGTGGVQLRYGATALPGGLDMARDADDHIAATSLSGDDPHTLLEDREGNVWVATQQGLDRFRAQRVLRSPLPGAGLHYSLARDCEGVVWAADARSGALWRLAPDAAPRIEPGQDVTVVGNDHRGALLLGGSRSIEVRACGSVEHIALPPGRDGKPVDLRLLGMRDDGKVLWIAAAETGLMGLVDGKWQPRSHFKLPPKIFVSATGGPGQLWLGLGDGELVLYDNGRQQVFDASAIGLASAIFTQDGVAISGERGLGVLKEGRIHLLRAAEPDVLRNLTGMHVTATGDRWLNGARGVLYVRRADWQRSVADPSQALRYELIGALEGYPGQAVTETRLPTAVADGAGRIWLAASGGVVSIDTRSWRRNPHAPSVAVLGVQSGGLALAGAGPVDLAPGAGEFSIGFTAPGIGRPEAMRFQYRLDGVDRDWQNAGNRRAAFYTNIGPGDYRFHVRATNEDGIPSAQAATVDVRVAPTLLESRPFQALCLLILAALAYLLHRYRVRYLTRRVAERIEVRNAERERIARTLHDTFLQTVQGLVLRLDTVVGALPAGGDIRRKLEQVLGEARHAIAEGRDQLQGLRGDAAAFEDALAATVRSLQETSPGTAVSIGLDDAAVKAGSAIGEDIVEIAREALRNAFLHAGARRIEVRLSCEHAQLLLEVNDDGKGIDDAVLKAGGRKGHWGLPGMQERAARVGGRLMVARRAGGGTAVRLAWPIEGKAAVS
ncbi:histidine kinase [Massilia sp. IC2-278]|uniref:sensor histidine kinase n=1 Tax=Massilia sp. IC2-278 TaxID=2887200 RepID=UPI001E544C80|nr:histidine kinase [Massilia sp. IC2-278]